MVFSAVALGLVVCLHLPSLPKWNILKFAVPWFFFASGFWYGRRPRVWRDEMKKRVKSLLMPYFLWNLIWYLILFSVNWILWKYFGVGRVVYGSLDSIVRCLGFSVWRWPALVPTWYLRALFVVVAVVGGLWSFCAAARKMGKYGEGACRIVVACVLSVAALSMHLWSPEGIVWAGFLDYGVSIHGMACFAVGGVVALASNGHDDETVGGVWAFMRKQMMPVYVLHAIVIMVCGWCARTLSFFDALQTPCGDVVMWFVAILGAMAIGWTMRRFIPKTAHVLFGGR